MIIKYKNMKKIVILILWLVTGLTTLGQHIIINELQPSNATTIADRDGDFSDWFELYNFSDSTINLEGWYVTDDPSEPYKWKFPQVLIPSEEYRIIFASDKDTVYPNGEVHTNFKIGNGDEGIHLYRADSTLADNTPVTEVLTDWSYGRYPDVAVDWFFFDEPTPGAGNTTQPYGSFAEPPVFSHSAGFYANSFYLEMTPAVPGDTIYYTLDGSVPTRESAIYTSPVLMASRANLPNRLSTIQTTLPGQGFSSWKLPNGNVYKFNTVRARVFKTGYYPSSTTSGSFIIDPLMSSKYNAPLISIMTDSVNFFCDTIGIYKAGVGIDSTNWLTAHFSQEGREWERDIHLEIFNENGTAVISQDAGVRISGNYTRTTNIKSLRLYARSEYGNSTFNYQFFDDLPLTDFKRLRLRNTGNDAQNAYMRDALINETIEPFFPAISRWRPSIVFIDGEYWGIHNIRERHDKYFFNSHFGIEYDNLDFLEMNSLVVEGTNTHYNAMLDFVSSNNMADSANYAYVCTQLDPENYAEYLVNSVYTGQTDWPVHNVRYWRNRTSSYQPQALYGQDGRWRWLLVDQDFGLGRSPTMGAGYDHLYRLRNGLSGWQNKLTVRLLGNNSNPGNEQFKKLFINTMADWMNTLYLPDRMLSIYQMFVDTLQPLMPEHINRWRYPASMYHWQSVYCPTITGYITQRPAFMRQFMVSNFALPGTFSLTLNVGDSTMGTIRVNSITIDTLTPGLTNPADPYPWAGIYYRSVPVQIEAIPNPGFAFSHWEGYTVENTPVITIDPTDTVVSLTAHFIPQYVPEHELVHFWLFDNNIPNDTPLDTINPVFNLVPGARMTFHSALSGYPFDPTHPNWRKASMERRNAPTPLNYRPEGNNHIPYGSFTMRAIQIKQPFTGDGGENTLLVEAPTTGYEDIIFRFAAKDELAADGIVVDYSVTDPPAWTNAGLSSDTLSITGDYQLFEVDFSDIGAADENPLFRIRLRFTGPNMSADLGNRVTFNNLSIDGISTYIPLDFYSKPSGPLTSLSTWGANPDGSGLNPPGFDMENTSFHIRNRSETTLESPWEVPGNGSKVIVGDGTLPITVQLNATLTGTIDVNANALLNIAVTGYPLLGTLAAGSTVEFSGTAQTIPYRVFHHLILDNINPLFSGNGTITVQGDLTLDGTVAMPDARGSNQYSLLFNGNGDQLITTGPNVLRSYNMTFTKTTGSVHFSPGSTYSNDNQFAATIGPDASFADDGATHYAGNSVNYGGTAASYNLTGTLILAGTEPGIVKGSGSGNSFNIRDADATNKNAVAAFNNIIVRVANTGGEFRFRDGSTNLFNIKGDFIVESGATGRIRFYTNNNLNIGGDFIIEPGFTGTIDAVKSVTFNGSSPQLVNLSLPVNVTQLGMSNSAGDVSLDGVLDISQQLLFSSGILKTTGTGLVKMGAASVITGNDDSRFIEGKLARRCSGTTPVDLTFPVGVNGTYLPFEFTVSHTGTAPMQYTGYITHEPSKTSLNEPLEYLVNDYRFRLEPSGTDLIATGVITLPFEEGSLGFDPQWLRIAQFTGSEWQNMGGLVSDSEVSSTENITETTLFALAKASETPVTPDSLFLQDITIHTGTDTCFGAVKQITVAGEGTTFLVSSNATVNLVAGERISMLPGTSVTMGGYLLAWIDPIGNYCHPPAAGPLAGQAGQALSFGHNKAGSLSFVIYPNPTEGWITIKLAESEINATTTVEIADLTGKKLLRQEDGPGNSIRLDLNGLSTGVYVVKVTKGSGTGFGKVIRQ